MKKIVLTFLILFLLIGNLVSQNNSIEISNALREIETGNFNNIILNNDFVEEFLTEYINEAKLRGIQIKSRINSINFILIEPESLASQQLYGLNLGKVDYEKKMILLSNNCLLDINLLKATLFREISHYFGVPYESYGIGIMSLNKPEGYSYSWLTCDNSNLIKDFAYFRLFKKLENALDDIKFGK